MKTGISPRVRKLIDLMAGVSAAAFVAVWLGAGGIWAIPAICILLIAACAAGWMESSRRSLWVHPLVIISPALVTVACDALIICPAIAGPRGFECAWVFVLLVLAVPLTPVLMGLSYATFFIRRWATR